MNDLGTYTAVAENIAGSCHTTAKLNLSQASHVDTTPIVNPEAFKYLERPVPERSRQAPDDIPASALKPPKFIVPLANMRFNEGSSAQLTCKLEGYPFPSVSWHKDGKPLPASNRLITNYNMNSGIVSLKISDVLVGDQGNYTVYAENKAGKDQTFCNVQVNQSPGIDRTSMVKPDAFKYLEAPKEPKRPDEGDRVNYQPPRFVVPLSNVRLNEGQPIQLAAKVEGNPKPKVREQLTHRDQLLCYQIN